MTTLGQCGVGVRERLQVSQPLSSEVCGRSRTSSGAAEDGSLIEVDLTSRPADQVLLRAAPSDLLDVYLGALIDAVVTPTGLVKAALPLQLGCKNTIIRTHSLIHWQHTTRVRIELMNILTMPGLDTPQGICSWKMIQIRFRVSHLGRSRVRWGTWGRKK